MEGFNDEQLQQLGTVTTILRSLQDSGAIPLVPAKQDPAKPTAAKPTGAKPPSAKGLPPPLWTQVQASAVQGGANTVKRGGSNTVKRGGDGVPVGGAKAVGGTKGQKGGNDHQWDIWNGGSQSSTASSGGISGAAGGNGRNNGSPKAKKSKDPPSAKKTPPTPLSRRQAKPASNTYDAPPRPQLRSLVPLRFYHPVGPTAPHKYANKPTTPVGKGTPEQANKPNQYKPPVLSRKRVSYGYQPLETGTHGMPSCNTSNAAGLMPLFDKGPVMEGGLGLRAFRMSCGGCLVTFESATTSGTSRSLLPFDALAIKRDVEQRLQYLQTGAGKKKMMAETVNDDELRLLRMVRAARDVILMHLSNILTGATNDRPMFLTKPLPAVSDHMDVDATMNASPEPVRTLMLLTMQWVGMADLDQAGKAHLVGESFKAVGNMLTPLRNGYPELSLGEPPQRQRAEEGGSSDEF